jgi:hypothetical protein
VGLGLAGAACGKKGPPLAPLRPVPAAVTTLKARRLGDTVRLTFTVPTTNADGSAPADLERIEIYGLTIDPAGDQPDLDEFTSHASLVARIDVQPPAPPPPAEGGAPPAVEPAPPPDPRPGQGAEVVVEETLTEASMAPVLVGTVRERPLVGPRTLAALAPVPDQQRTYLALAASHRNRWSRPSPRVTVPLGPMPAPPDAFAVAYTESAFVLSWDPGPPDPWQPIWPLFKFSRGVDVYEVTGAGVVSPTPLDAAPVTAATFEVPLETFGEPRCFVARTTESVGTRVWSGALSSAACATPVDTFAPAAPTGLAAVSSGGVISLIWDANAERDLAGYMVLRAEAPDDTLRAVTAAPIRDTTYRDADVRPGVRYVYAVVAVDTASPPNESEPSARVEETAR